MTIILPSSAKNARKPERTIRPARPSRSIKKRYETALDDQVRYLKAQTANLADILRSGADRQQVARTLATMSAAAQRRAESTALSLATAFVGEVDQQNKEALQASIARAFSVDFANIIDGPDIAADLQMAIARNVDLIKSISQQHFAEVGQAVLDNYRGVPLPGGVSLQDRLQKIGGISKNRAKLIARDQTAKLTGDLNQLRQADNGIEEYIWRNAGDQRVVGNPSGLYPKGNAKHGNHWDREGKVFRWDSPPSDGHPGTPINCFPGSTMFDMSNGCHKFWRRRYKGRLVTIIPCSGVALEATPNHPVLTIDGWKAIDELQEGDDIFKPVTYCGRIDELNVSEFCASAKDVFDLMLSVGSLSASAGSELDFHGDGREEDIYAIDTESLLRNDAIAGFLKSSSELGFSRAYADLPKSGLHGAGPLGSALKATLFSAHSIMSLGGYGLPLGIAEQAHSNKIGFAPAAAWDMVVSKYSTNNPASDAVLLGKRKLADSGAVEGAHLALWKIGDLVVCRVFSALRGIHTASAEMFAEVVRSAPEANAYFFEGDASLYERFRVIEKRLCDFSGHVYNIQTNTGWYNANGVVTHNCRCYAAPKLDLEKIKAQYV